MIMMIISVFFFLEIREAVGNKIYCTYIYTHMCVCIKDIYIYIDTTSKQGAGETFFEMKTLSLKSNRSRPRI